VVKNRKGANWLCEIVNEPIEIEGKVYESDWVGTQKVFGTEEIRAALEMNSFVASLMDASEAFYTGLKLGSIVHYHNGFGSFVRCRVVRKEGKNELLPLALVGNWREHDLPHYNVYGEVDHRYYPRKIVDGETITPHASNIYEYPSFSSRPETPNPSTLPEVDLTLPPLTPEAEAKAALCRKIREINAACDLKSPEESFKRIREILEDEV